MFWLPGDLAVTLILNAWGPNHFGLTYSILWLRRQNIGTHGIDYVE